MKTTQILRAIGSDPELEQAHRDNIEFRNLLTHVTQESDSDEAIRVLCRGYLQMLAKVNTGVAAPLSDEPADHASPVNPQHP